MQDFALAGMVALPCFFPSVGLQCLLVLDKEHCIHDSMWWQGSRIGAETAKVGPSPERTPVPCRLDGQDQLDLWEAIAGKVGSQENARILLANPKEP